MKLDKNMIYAILHLCVALSWGPLSWVISDDVIVHYFGEYRHLTALKWGISSTGVMINLSLFLYRYSKVDDDVNNEN